MSILLRYALHYNCRQHLDQLDRLKTILVEKGFVDGDGQGTVPAESRQSERNMALAVDLSEEDAENRQRADVESGPESDFCPAKTNKSTHNASTLLLDGADGREADDSSERIGSSLDRNGDLDKYDDDNERLEKNGNEPLGEDRESISNTGLDTGPSLSSSHGHISAAAMTPVLTTPARTNVGKPVNIRRSQIDHFLAIDTAFRRISQAISEGLTRLDSEQAEQSSSLIIHFWNEAARLKGSEPVQSPRMQKRAFCAADWGAGDQVDSPDVNNSRFPGNKEKRPCTSPLAMAFKPDDLIWEDQLSNWQLNIGRARDEEGRRCLKI